MNWKTEFMTRTKNWLLVGTILPAVAMAQAGFAAPVTTLPLTFELAQAPPAADDEPGRPRRERAPGVPRAPGAPSAPGVETPRAPAPATAP
ncbi:hypothetical protein IP69_10770, partial [Bosea sp. AAP35]